MSNGDINGTGTEGAAISNGQNHVHLNGSLTSLDTSAALRDVTAWTPERRLDIITIGAGFSGLIFAHKLQHQYPEMQQLVNHKIFEARDDIGGTWLVNRYPGVQCDIPAHIYVLTPCQMCLPKNKIESADSLSTSHSRSTPRPTGPITTPLGHRSMSTCERRQRSGT